MAEALAANEIFAHLKKLGSTGHKCSPHAHAMSKKSSETQLWALFRESGYLTVYTNEHQCRCDNNHGTALSLSIYLSLSISLSLSLLSCRVLALFPHPGGLSIA